jgi:hypothetical protein
MLFFILKIFIFILNKFYSIYLYNWLFHIECTASSSSAYYDYLLLVFIEKKEMQKETV